MGAGSGIRPIVIRGLDPRIHPSSQGSSRIRLLDQPRFFRYHAPMKTRSIEVDDDTATALTQRAAERGVSVPELLAELVTLETGPLAAAAGDIAGTGPPLEGVQGAGIGGRERRGRALAADLG